MEHVPKRPVDSGLAGCVLRTKLDTASWPLAGTRGFSPDGEGTWLRGHI